MKFIMISHWSSFGLNSLLMMLILFRLANAILCRSLFVPDEHWQSLEVAYNIVFEGYLSWEWHKAIRGYSHPLIFAIVYKTLALCNLDYPNVMAVGPRLLQGVLAGIADLYVYRTARVLFDSHTAKYSLLHHVLSWFTFYCCTRTLSNSIESALTPIVLYYWIGAVRHTHTQRCMAVYLILSAISVIIRPTGAVLFGPLFVYHFLVSNKRFRLVSVALLIGCCCLLACLVIDRYFYGKWVLTLFNFFKFNVFEGSSAIFGTHSWHWYFSQGIPTILFTSMPFVIHGVWLARKDGNHIHMVPVYMSLWLVLSHSLLKHKEFRFIQPIIPLTSVYIGVSLKNILHSKVYHYCVIILTIILLVLNIPMSCYFCIIHQRGGYAVMDQLRYQHIQDNLDNSTILFLMPCHSTPQYSLLHTKASMDFLHCSYTWEPTDHIYREDYFYSNSISWIEDNVVNSVPMPTHLIMYNVLYEEVKPIVDKYYQTTNEIFHTHFRDNDRVGNSVLILEIINK